MTGARPMVERAEGQRLSELRAEVRELRYAVQVGRLSAERERLRAELAGLGISPPKVAAAVAVRPSLAEERAQREAEAAAHAAQAESVAADQMAALRAFEAEEARKVAGLAEPEPEPEGRKPKATAAELADRMRGLREAKAAKRAKGGGSGSARSRAKLAAANAAAATPLDAPDDWPSSEPFTEAEAAAAADPTGAAEGRS